MKELIFRQSRLIRGQAKHGKIHRNLNQTATLRSATRAVRASQPHAGSRAVRLWRPPTSDVFVFRRRRVEACKNPGKWRVNHIGTRFLARARRRAGSVQLRPCTHACFGLGHELLHDGLEVRGLHILTANTVRRVAAGGENSRSSCSRHST